MEYSINRKTYTLIPDNGIDINSLTDDEKFLIRDGIYELTMFKDQSIIRNISKRYHIDFIDFDKCKIYLCKNKLKIEK